LRVAIVRQRYNPYGGAERFIERAIPALERAGVELTLVGRSRGNWPAQRFVAADPFFAGNFWRDWSFAQAARRRWREAGFDLVQSHERIPGCSVYRAGDGVHAAWLDIRRARAGPMERLGLALNPYHRYVCAAERRMFEHPALRAVVCNSVMVRDEILAAFAIAPEKLHVIYNGVDLEHFHPRQCTALRDGARAELSLAPQDVAFLFVGSGFARKGLDAAIRALAACAGEKFHLLVAGTDRQAARYAALARELGVGDRLHLLGGRADVRPLYAAADCFILPTRYDPFPSSALEALAMGLPAIVGRRSGAAEVVRAGESGWICDPRDPAALALLMRDAGALAGDAVAGGALRAAARATAERYGIEDMARKLTELYAALLAPARA
jgi:UDP-glucose:(heptosyl)LPS alpha-1,3-glucosyltransferase